MEGALKDLFAGYRGFKETDAPFTEIVYDDERLTLRDVEEEIVFLCLHFIKKADTAVKEEQYEDALSNFCLVNKCWETLYYSLGLVLESEEYEEKYAEIGITYSPQKVEGMIRICIGEIENEAERLKEQGKLEESNNKYDLIIKNLVKADWKDKEEINKFELKKSDVEPTSGTHILCIAGLLVAAAVFLMYWRRKKGSSE